MWEQLKRVTKKNGAIVLFGSQPFTSALVMSNPKMFKYEWVWDKKNISNPFLAKYQPLKQHENIIVFGGKNYFPQMEQREVPRKYKDKYGGGDAFNKKGTGEKEYTLDAKYPKSIIELSNAEQKGKVHPTQKPVALGRYLVRTYTNEGDTVLDFTAGSGSFGVAAVLEKRHFIGIEKDEGYFKIMKERIEKAQEAAKYAVETLDIDGI